MEKMDIELCSECDTQIGKWHNQFPKIYLEAGKWKTNDEGNLEHIESHRTDYWNCTIEDKQVNCPSLVSPPEPVIHNGGTTEKENGVASA
jgi:hypothetical protein